MRINQFVAASSGLSRRAADTAIATGRVKVGDRLATVGEDVAADSPVQLDGELLSPHTAYTYVMLNKPPGYVASRTKQGSDPTVYELLGKQFTQLRPAGRLDRDSSGLMLFSNDGQFIQRLTHPSFHKAKIYELELSRPLSREDVEKLESGVQLTDGPSRLKVLDHNQNKATVSLGEGRNRQLRRTFGALGYAVQTLHRTAIGPYALGELPSGSWLEVGEK